jgi:hypothetical protein
MFKKPTFELNKAHAYDAALDMNIGRNGFAHTLWCYLGLTCFFNKPMYRRGSNFLYINNQCLLKLAELTEKSIIGL